VQGGLEVPCVLRFKGDGKRIAKVKALSKKRKIDSLDGVGGCTNSTGDSTRHCWVRQGGIVLATTDKEHILSGKKLNDLHINLAQSMLKQQFSELAGLKSTLLQTKKHTVEEKKEQIQIVHSRGDHWIVASSIHAAGNEVLVYDSIYPELDSTTNSIILNFFPTSTSAELVEISRQTGGEDCGVFAISGVP
jgi:hypothetical protein